LEDIGQHDKDFAEAEKSALGLAGALKEPTAAAGELGDKIDGAGTQMKETAVDARFLADELKKARKDGRAHSAHLRLYDYPFFRRDSILVVITYERDETGWKGVVRRKTLALYLCPGPLPTEVAFGTPFDVSHTFGVRGWL